MSALMSVFRRAADSDLAQDLCAGIVICLFIAACGYGLAGIADLVAAVRVAP